MIKTYPQEMVAFGELQDDAMNPREMPRDMMARLKASLVEFGFVQPVVARREDGLVLGGHQRRAAFVSLMRDQNTADDDIAKTPIPVVYIEGLTDAKAKVLNLALNKISGDWDYEKLPDVLASLADTMEMPDMTLTGFSVDEITDIAGLVAHTQKQLDAIANDTDVEEEVAKQLRRFVFTFETDNEAKYCRAVLTAYGMTGPGNAAKTLMEVLNAARKALPATAVPDWPTGY